MLDFEFIEDKIYFSKLLCEEGEDISKYSKLFDFRNPHIKRIEFNKIRNSVINQLIRSCGPLCKLSFDKICDISSGYNIDHVIPISTNKLNKELRNLEKLNGKKVKAQSFGSNNFSNLVLACSNCNSYKKHKILTRREIKKILGRN